MYRPDMYDAGEEELPDGDSPLRVEVAVREHVQCCEECSGAGGLQETCYFSRMSSKVPVTRMEANGGGVCYSSTL